MPSLRKAVALLGMLAATFFSFGQNKRSDDIGLPLIRNHLPKEYGAHIQNWSVTQDNKGVVYFANRKGVVLEHDGYEWRQIPFPSSSIRVVKSDGGERVYVGGEKQFGYMSSDNTGRMVYTPLTHLADSLGASFTEIWFIETMPDGKVYFGAFEHIFIYKNGKLSTFKNMTERDFRPVILLPVGNDMYVNHKLLGLAKLSGAGLNPVENADALKGKNILRISVLPEKPDALLVFATTDTYVDLEMYEYNLKEKRLQKMETEVSKTLNKGLAFRVEPLSDGNFAISSYRRGLFVVNAKGDVLRLLNKSQGLHNESITNSMQDKNGNIWLTSDNGISFWEYDSPFSFFDIRNGFMGNGLNVNKFNGKIIASSAVGAFEMDPSQTPQGASNRFKEIDNIYNQTRALIPFKNHLLIGNSAGIYSYDGQKAKKIKDVLGDPYSAIDLLRYSKKENLIFIADKNRAVQYAVVKNSGSQDSDWPAKPSGLLDEETQAKDILEDEDGNVWINTENKGIHKISFEIDAKGNPINFKDKSYFKKETNNFAFFTLLFKFEGKLKFALGTKIFEYDKQKDVFEPDNLLTGLIPKNAQHFDKVTQGPDGKLWFLGNGKPGFAFRDQKGRLMWEDKLFHRLPSAEYSNLFFDDDSVVWIVSSEALIRFEDKKASLDRIKKMGIDCLIRRIKFGDDDHHPGFDFYGDDSHLLEETASGGYHPRLDFTDNDLRVEYAGIFYEDLVENTYSYKLLGFDAEWSEWLEDNHKEYTNLHEGEYTFMVKAKNVYDMESEIAKFSFEIKPPWYRAWWAYMLYSATVLAGAMFFARIYSRRLIERQKELENVIEERTGEIKKQNSLLTSRQNELEKQKDELEQQKTEIDARNTELGSLNATKDRFISIISHDLKGPLNSLSGFSKLLINYIDHLSKEEIRSTAVELDKSLNNLYKLIENLLLWSRSQSGGHDHNPENVDLGDLVVDTLELLDLIAKNKNIKLVSKIEKPLFVYADSNALKTVLRNLNSNALKFTKEGGEVSVEAERKGDLIQIAVRDNGVGMDEEAKNKIFRIDAKHSTRGTQNETGTGLGLLLCKEFVEKHKGKIWLESTPDVGTVFFFTIPAAIEETLPPKPIEKPNNH